MVFITYSCMVFHISQQTIYAQALLTDSNDENHEFNVVVDDVTLETQVTFYMNEQLTEVNELGEIFDHDLISNELKLTVDGQRIDLDTVELSIKNRKLELKNIHDHLKNSIGSFQVIASFEVVGGDLSIVIDDKIKSLPNSSRLILDDDWSARLGMISGKLNNKAIELSEAMVIADNNHIFSNELSITLDDSEAEIYPAEVHFSNMNMTISGVNHIIYQANHNWQGCFKSAVYEGELTLCFTSRLLPDRYIITFQDDIKGEEKINELSDHFFEKYNGKKGRIFDKVLFGFSGGFNPSLINELTNETVIKTVSRDALAYANAVQDPTTSWGIDRLDERYNINDNRFTYNSTGLGVHVYIIDSGVNRLHPDFVGRFGQGASFIQGKPSYQVPNYQDCLGHGTHVAGTILGTNHGVAKGATIHSVRVFDCSNSAPASDIIAAVNYVTGTHRSPSVVNMSLGIDLTPYSSSSNGLSINSGSAHLLEAAIQNSIDAGFTYVVSSGNANMNACQFASPARFDPVITVGAVKSNGQRWYEHYYYPTRTEGSNTGWCVDIQAPGHNIVSANTNDFNNDLALTGTSMAAPHVTGIAALYLQYYPSASPSWLRNEIVNVSTKNILWGLAHSHNRMAYWPEKCLNSFTLTHGVTVPAGQAYLDGAACMVLPVPHGADPFIWNNGFYIQPGPGNSCMIGIYDGANCYIGHPPAGGRSYIHNGNFIYFD